MRDATSSVRVGIVLARDAIAFVCVAKLFGRAVRSSVRVVGLVVSSVSFVVGVGANVVHEAASLVRVAASRSRWVARI